MIITCSNCDKSFEPSQRDRDFIQSAAGKGMRVAFITCPHCPPVDNEISVDPVAIVNDKEDIDPNVKTNDAKSYRCPVSRCSGWVSFVEEESSFWGCGECGSVWYDKNNLMKEISDIIKRYKYRKNSYTKSGTEWLPGNMEKEDTNYEEKVEKEPSGMKDNFVRG